MDRKALDGRVRPSVAFLLVFTAAEFSSCVAGCSGSQKITSSLHSRSRAAQAGDLSFMGKIFWKFIATVVSWRTPYLTDSARPFGNRSTGMHFKAQAMINIHFYSDSSPVRLNERENVQIVRAGPSSVMSVLEFSASNIMANFTSSNILHEMGPNPA